MMGTCFRCVGIGLIQKLLLRASHPPQAAKAGCKEQEAPIQKICLHIGVLRRSLSLGASAPWSAVGLGSPSHHRLEGEEVLAWKGASKLK